jgi:3-dehydroquinate dehydratase-2
MKIMVINGPNLNLLGRREPELYGQRTLGDIEQGLKDHAEELGIEVGFLQSNVEGELVDAVQNADENCSGIILNGGAYTHTGVALRDAVAGISVPAVEVHLTDPRAREEFRRTSLLAGVCAGSISGFGEESYHLALLYFHRLGSSE